MAGDLDYTAEGEPSNELSSISCEPCRNKKRKCDRKFPACSLCTNSSTPCNYPERGKRGMPIGYITALEKRLIEVEGALFQVYADYQQYREGLNVTAGPIRGTIKALEEYYGGLTKQEKIAEWESHDILDACERWEWWKAKNEALHMGVDFPIIHMSHDEVLKRMAEQERWMYERHNRQSFAATPSRDSFSTSVNDNMSEVVMGSLNMHQKYKYF